MVKEPATGPEKPDNPDPVVVYAPVPPVAPVPAVPYWTYLVPIGVAVIGAIQVVVVVWLGNQVQNTTTAVEKVEKKVEETAVAINGQMHETINSAIEAAIARERLKVAEKALAEEEAADEAPDEK